MYAIFTISNYTIRFCVRPIDIVQTTIVTPFKFSFFSEIVESNKRSIDLSLSWNEMELKKNENDEDNKRNLVYMKQMY